MFKLFLVMYILIVLHAEYQIKEGVIPSFLNVTLHNLSEEIFPKNIFITLLLSRFSGTLLYSIDSNHNQLIISLNDAMTPTIVIEFNNQISYFSLSQQCGCRICRFKIIKLRIQIKEMIYLQCDDLMSESQKYGQKKKLNKDYPIPKFDKSDKLQAFLWLVNTPFMDGIYPNSAQLSGCIFEVAYNDQLIEMDKHGVGDKCTKACTDNICHSGECLETYQTYPVCNCTDSFKDGKFCNRTLHNGSYKIQQLLQFKIIKFAFNTSSLLPLELYNNRMSLRIDAKKNILSLIINSTQPNAILIKVLVTKEYRADNENIMIIEFNDKNLVIKFRDNTSPWSHIYIPHYYDFSREILEGINLQNDNGVFDLLYKNDKHELRWSQLDYSNYKKVIKIKNTTEMEEGKNTISHRNYTKESSKKAEMHGGKEKKELPKETFHFGITAEILIGLSLVNVLLLVVIIVLFFVRKKTSTTTKRRKADDDNVSGENMMKEENML